MSPTTKLVMERSVLRTCLAALVTMAACGIDTAEPSTTTYTELFTKYFGPDTLGHCAADGCHLDASNGWACGTDKDTCYMGMVGIRMINPAEPMLSTIGDPLNSPISWVNPNAVMPSDNPSPFPPGRDAILEWVAAGAQNN